MKDMIQHKNKYLKEGNACVNQHSICDSPKLEYTYSTTVSLCYSLDFHLISVTCVKWQRFGSDTNSSR